MPPAIPKNSCSKKKRKSEKGIYVWTGGEVAVDERWRRGSCRREMVDSHTCLASVVPVSGGGLVELINKKVEESWM